jgi:HlyD family secretion protein
MQLKARTRAIAFTLIAACVLALFSSGCQEASIAGTIEASGTIEADEVVVATEFEGRVDEVLADEGNEVESGQVLLRLDTGLLEASLAEAQAAVSTAQANLSRVEAGARPGEIETARALLDQAIAARDGAQRALQDAEALRDNPQELNAQVDQARTQVTVAEHGVDQAQAQLQTVIIQRDAYAGAGDDESKTRYAALDEQAEAARVAVSIAEETLDGATTHLQDVLDLRDNPIALNSAVNQAKAQSDDAAAAAEVAQASLDALLAKPTAEEVAVAQAQVNQAEAALGVLQVQLDKMTLYSPLSGLVSSRSINVGETASPGATLMTVANLDQVKLTVYIPENRYGRIQLGQQVGVQVDTFPGKVYAGQVVYISSEAEFTPRNVQTKEERVNTVFAVKILIPNPDHDLKPGMPADATITVE